MLRTLHHDGHPAPRRHLRFAQWRADGLVAFAADKVEGRTGLLDGHPSGDRFALMCTLARFLPEVGVEVDGERVRGKLGRPDPDTGRTPFHVQGTLAPPTRPMAWLRWEVAGQAYLAECAVRTDRNGGWLLDLPRAVEGSDRRLLPRWELGPGWRFEPLATAPAGLGAPMAVLDLSPVGASLHLHTREPADEFLGLHVAGTLMAPLGEGLRLRCEVRRAALHPEAEGVLLGVSFDGLGFEQTARLVDWLPAELPEDASAPIEPGAHPLHGRGHGHGHPHGHEAPAHPVLGPGFPVLGGDHHREGHGFHPVLGGGAPHAQGHGHDEGHGGARPADLISLPGERPRR